MPTFKSSAPTHLSIFVTDPDSGQPVAQLPLYAEVAVPRIVTVPAPDDRFADAIIQALNAADPSAQLEQVRDRVVRATKEALSGSNGVRLA